MRKLLIFSLVGFILLTLLTTVVFPSSAAKSPLPLAMVTSSLCNDCSGTGAPVVMLTYNNTLDTALQNVFVTGTTNTGKLVTSISTASIPSFGARQLQTVAFFEGGLSPGIYFLSAAASSIPFGGPTLSGTSTVVFQVLQNGSLFIGQAMDWTIISTPTVIGVSGSPASRVTYQSNLDFPTTGIVYLVIHNDIGQTVTFSTATLVLAGHDAGTAYDVIFGLPPGSYHATIFVASVSSVALSSSTPFNFTIR